jgi:hypothetical protein
VIQLAGLFLVVGTLPVSNVLAAADQVFSPGADGTLVDGLPYGPFDGNADAWDWTFNQSSYEGNISLSNESAESGFESRVVWEYDLSVLSTALPVTAELRFTLRGAPRFPAEAAPVSVYAYPADLLETPEDFSSPPIGLVGIIPIEPYQRPTTYTLSVGAVVNDTLHHGVKRIGFRFQIAPDAPPGANQAFLDALETDKLTKPQLIINAAVPGDADQDQDVDLDDFAIFTACMTGPGGTATPACMVFDFDLDADVDLLDLQAFLYYRSLFAH